MLSPELSFDEEDINNVDEYAEPILDSNSVKSEKVTPQSQVPGVELVLEEEKRESQENKKVSEPSNGPFDSELTPSRVPSPPLNFDGFNHEEDISPCEGDEQFSSPVGSQEIINAVLPEATTDK